MFLGAIFKNHWSAADEGAKLAAAAIATGAKVVGEIPVLLAHMEAAAATSAERAGEGIAKGTVAVAKTVSITASEWKGWMDVKVAQTAEAVGLDTDVEGTRRNSEMESLNVRRDWENTQKKLNTVTNSLQHRVASANQQRLNLANRMKDRIAATGKALGNQLEQGVAAVGNSVESLLRQADAIIAKGVIRTVAGVIGAYKDLKSYMGDKPVESPAQPCSLQRDRSRNALLEAITRREKLVDEARTAAAHAPRGEAAEIKNAADRMQRQVDGSNKALMAADVYNDPSPYPEVAPGWKRMTSEEIKALNLSPGDFSPADSQFRAALYKSDGEPPQFTLAFKGTKFDSEQDWENNILQGLGLESDYYKRAMGLADATNVATRGRLDVTGHSLGGGLASAAAASVGLSGVTFNASGVDPETVPNIDLAQAGSKLDVYQVAGEPLTTAQNYLPLPGALGSAHELAAPEGADLISKHSMDSVMQGMNGDGISAEAALAGLTRNAMAAGL